MVEDKDTIVGTDSITVVINGRSVAISKDMLSAGGELTFDQIFGTGPTLAAPKLHHLL